MDEILTIGQTADYLKVSIATVRRLIKAKRLNAAKVGNQYRIRKADVDRFFQSGEQAHPSSSRQEGSE